MLNPKLVTPDMIAPTRPTPGAEVLSVRNVTRGFSKTDDEQLVLDGVNLTLREGEIVGLLGRSGSGKSTLLRIISGLIEPTAGEVDWLGKPLDGPAEGVAMVFQTFALFPWLTVADNVAFGLREKGVPAVGRTRIVEQWLSRIGLDAFAKHYPKQLSGGMQQRTAIARALANDPAILLLDEPFGALDNQTRALMQELLLGIWERDRKTVLFVTHDIEEAIFLATRVLVMSARPGRIKAEVAV